MSAEDLIQRLAEETGLTWPGQPFKTDYGDSREEIIAFAQAVAKHCAEIGDTKLAAFDAAAANPDLNVAAHTRRIYEANAHGAWDVASSIRAEFGIGATKQAEA